MPQLRIEVPGRAYTAELPDAPLRVGSGEACELRLSCEGVSALHCTIDPLPDGRHRLKDLQSGFPTRVNGIAVKQVALQPGDVIEVGEARLVYAPGTVAPVAPPPSAAARPAAAGAGAPRVEREPARSGSHRRLAVLAGGIGGAGLLIAVLAIVLGGSRGGAARVARDLEDAERLARAGDADSAREAFERVAADPDAGEGRLTAQRWLQRLAEAESDAKQELDRIAAEWQEFDLGGADTRRSILVQRHGASFGPRFDAAVAQVRTRQDAWAAQRIAETRTTAEGAAAAGRFGEALATWTRLRSASARSDVRSAAADGMAGVEAAAKTAASALLETADRLAREGKPAPAATLREALPRFSGTAAEATLLARARDLEAAAVRATPVVSPSSSPGPKPESAPGKDGEKVAAALRDAEVAAKDLRFAVAVATLDAAGATSLSSGPTRERLSLRRRELDLARAGLDALAADVRANTVRYDGVVVAGTQAVSLLDADADGVTASVAGGRAKHRWATIGAERIAGIASRWRGDAPTTLAMASFLHEVGARDAFEATAARLAEGSPEATALFPLLARWRGEAAAPAGGYVLHEGRWRTPAERDAIVLEGKVREAALRLDAKDAAARKKAVDDLLALGPAARPGLLGALGARRERLVRALAADRVFTQTKTRQRVFDELEKRRREALSLIQDSVRYPYPSSVHQGQEQVDALVERVRQAWDHPFDLVAEWDKGVQEALAGITEVDESISRAQPGYKPDLDALREAASRAIDMPSFAPPSHAATREYSVKVLAYNLKVLTSATPEERDDVLAVNEYRMMMGRRALKIEERLMRTARGHSRWMREHDVFAHDVDDPERRTPGMRAKRQGYLGGVGENIARGTSTGREAFDAWAHSSGHHRNMLAEGWTEMGAGRSGELWWTQNFGAASQLSLVDPEPLPAPSAETAAEPEGPTSARGPGTPQLPDDAPPGMPPPPPPDEPKPPSGG